MIFRAGFFLNPPGHEVDQETSSESDPVAPLRFEIYLTFSCCLAIYDALSASEKHPLSPIEADQAEQELRTRLGRLKVPLRAVATQMNLTIADCTRLQIGQVLAAPGFNLDMVSLCINGDPETEQIARARLGFDKGTKAVRLCQSIDPAFLTNSLKEAS